MDSMEYLNNMDFRIVEVEKPYVIKCEICEGTTFSVLNKEFELVLSCTECGYDNVKEK